MAVPLLSPQHLEAAHHEVWADERTLTAAGASCVLGEIVRVRLPDGRDAYCELAARVPAFKVGLPGRQRVWWLLLIDPSKEVPDDAAGAAQDEEGEA